jgi:uncharacterized membrane protein
MPLSTELRAIVQNRPLRWGLIAGIAAGLALAFAPNALGVLTRWLVAWDVALAVYLAVLIHKMIGASPEHMTKHAAETDEGRHFILFVSLAGVVVSIAAIFIEAGAQAQSDKALHVGFVMLTVPLSWLFVHASFATHYTHEYYGPLDGKEGVRKGLMFPGDEEPDFWDFWHFALVIGVANQTADVQISNKAIRRIVTLHGVAAFVFNTVILALTINLAAGLLQ